MRKTLIISILAALSLAGSMSSCGGIKGSSRSRNADATVRPTIVSYNELTMNLDSVGITHTIDVSTAEGQLKLNKLSLREAEELALVEAVMKANCATLFNPQYTHLRNGKKILRVTVYGFPARYKRLEQQERQTHQEKNISVKIEAGS